jgi:hypothetical protein
MARPVRRGDYRGTGLRTPVLATPSGAVPEIVDAGATDFIRDTEADLVDALHHVGEIDRHVAGRSPRRYSRSTGW